MYGYCIAVTRVSRGDLHVAKYLHAQRPVGSPNLAPEVVGEDLCNVCCEVMPEKEWRLLVPKYLGSTMSISRKKAPDSQTSLSGV